MSELAPSEGKASRRRRVTIGLVVLGAIIAVGYSFLPSDWRWKSVPDREAALADQAPTSSDTARAEHPDAEQSEAVTIRNPEEIEFEDFVGAEACGHCHAEQYTLWRKSTHGLAGGNPSADTVISNFDGTVLRFSNATISMEVNQEKQFVYHVDQVGQARQSFAVAGFVGGGHMLGGGTQASFTRYSDGSWRLLPFDYSRHSDLWFCDARSGRGWLPITVELPVESCQFWPPVNNFGPNCGNCHSSQMNSRFDPATSSEQVRFSSLAINCESCHGPGRRHKELMESGNRDELADIGMQPLQLLDKKESVQVCFRCHALTQKLAPGYLPGKPYEEYYSVNFYPDGRRFADGRVRGFGYQEGHLHSDCYLNGSMTCVDCHDPHSQGYRDIDDYALPGKLDDGQCLDCHASKATNIPAHTGHATDSPGSRCVACHMPFQQHGSIGQQVRFERSDHTIPVPRPALDAQSGLQTACADCHPDRSIEWQQSHLQAWHGPAKPQKPIIRALQQLEGGSDKTFARQALIQTFAAHPAAQFDLLRRAGDILDLRSGTRDSAINSRLDALALDQDLDVSALAQALLVAPATAPAAANHSPPTDVALRRRIGYWLSMWGVSELRGGNPTMATNLLKKSLDHHPTLISTWFALADVNIWNGQTGAALDALRGASATGLASRDEYLLLLDYMCGIFDSLNAQGMSRKPSTDALCDDARRRSATPVDE